MSISVTKTNSTTAHSTSSTASTSSSDAHGLLFAGRNDAGKENNTEVFANLDSKAQQIIRDTIGSNAYMNPAKIAKALNAAGITANVGTSKVDPKDSDPTSYLEITNSDGSKSRIWDVGSDGGIGTQDIDLNAELSKFKSSVESAAADTTANNVTATADVTDVVDSVDAVEATDSTTEVADTEKTSTENNTSSSTGYNNTSLSQSEYYTKFDSLLEELKQNSSYEDYSDTQLEDLAREQLAKQY